MWGTLNLASSMRGLLPPGCLCFEAWLKGMVARVGKVSIQGLDAIFFLGLGFEITLYPKGMQSHCFLGPFHGFEP